MNDLNVKSDSSRPIWYISDDLQNSLTDTPRQRIISRPHVWRPPTDVYETEEAIIVRVEVAGMKESDFSIQLSERALLIRGSRQDIPERRAYHQMEIPFGEFSTEVELPFPIISDQVEAVYRDGFLRVSLPKARPRQIKVGS